MTCAANWQWWDPSSFRPRLACIGLIVARGPRSGPQGQLTYPTFGSSLAATASASGDSSGSKEKHRRSSPCLLCLWPPLPFSEANCKETHPAKRVEWGFDRSRRRSVLDEKGC